MVGGKEGEREIGSNEGDREGRKERREGGRVRDWCFRLPAESGLLKGLRS